MSDVRPSPSDAANALTVDTIRAAHKTVVPGPWRWFGNVDNQQLFLGSQRRGVVMDFVRWGMSRAQARFPNAHNLMEKTTDLVVFEVAPTATSRTDERVYRGDLIGIRNPHADYLARSWEYVEHLLGEVEQLREERDAAHRLLGEASGQRGELRAAAGPATSGQPGHGRELAAALAPDLNALARPAAELDGVHSRDPNRPRAGCGCKGCRRARGEATDA